MEEDFIDNIITNIKILGMIQINEKLCIRKGHLQIDYISNVRSFKRWLFRDSRDTILIYIKELIRNLTVILKTPDKWTLTRILNEMDNALSGLGNLKTTYSDDPIMIVTFDNIIIKFKELCQNARTCLV